MRHKSGIDKMFGTSFPPAFPSDLPPPSHVQPQHHHFQEFLHQQTHAAARQSAHHPGARRAFYFCCCFYAHFLLATRHFAVADFAQQVNAVDIRTEKLQWRAAVSAKAPIDVSLLDVQRLFREFNIQVADGIISKLKLNGALLTSESIDVDELMKALGLNSLRDMLLLRHLRQSVRERTLAFTLIDFDADNALTWDEGQVLAWLRRYRGDESLMFLEEACERERLNGIAMLQVDKNVLKEELGVQQLSVLDAALLYIQQIRIAPGPLSQLLQKPWLTISRTIDPPTDIRLHDINVESPFAAWVRKCARRTPPNFTVSRVSRVSVDKSREEAFCSLLNREANSRKANAKLRPVNLTDSAFVAGLQALKLSFEKSTLGGNSDCNIVFAWHGPPPEYVESVCRDNPRSFRTTDSGFFGVGSYFALELDYAAHYATMRPPNTNGEYGVILFAVMVSAAYIVTPSARDYPADDPHQPMRSGFSRFFSPDPQSSIALMPGYSSHFVPVKYSGYTHAVSGVQLPYDTDYQAAAEGQAGALPEVLRGLYVFTDSLFQLLMNSSSITASTPFL